VLALDELDEVGELAGGNMRVVDGMRGFAGLVEGEVGGELAEV
jgi:hypothetical protein